MLIVENKVNRYGFKTFLLKQYYLKFKFKYDKF